VDGPGRSDGPSAATALAESLIDAINRHDTAAALSALHEDIVLTPLVVRTGLAPKPFRGHAEARAYLDRIPALWGGDSRMALQAVHEAGGMFVAFCDAVVPDGGRLPVTYVGRIEDGRVLELAAFADLDQARTALGAPEGGPGLPPIELRLPAVAASVPAGRRALLGFLAAHNVEGRLQARIALAATEAMTNVVVHAYRDSAEPGDMTVRGEIGRTGLLVSVADDGCGLRARLDSPGLGLGLALMSRESAELSFVVAPERAAGTEVRLRFNLS
jgi:anti-sigma regulatory factor (Ser/Thr protein kinase)/ketosteroid isomerase-like protein